MGVWRLIAEDIRAWKRHGLGRSGEKVRLSEAFAMYFRYAGLRATVLYRLSCAVRRLHIPGLSLMLWHRCIRRYGLDIVPGIKIGPGLYIAHPVGTVIMAQRIGNNLSITTSVTIGMRTTPDFPVIGDNVTIGAGARVLGGITIGDGASVGANAVVLSDVPAGATAVGIPARILLPKSMPQSDYTPLANGSNAR